MNGDSVTETVDKTPQQGIKVVQKLANSDNPLDNVKYEQRKSMIVEPDGTTVFEMNDVEIPSNWSQLATDIIASKYMRKAGVPKTGSEISAKQVVYRIANTLRSEGEKLGYFRTKADAQAFENDLSYMLIHQIGAFNSPVWFNCGLFHQYNIKGSGGNYAWDYDQHTITKTSDSYSRPQCSACFIQSVDDDLMSIFDLAKNEARLFKYGSGTGTNFSKLRGAQEKLSSGGKSSGLMSFLEVLDRGAGATKSGGTTRRAAKMVCLDMDHPEIVDFINWKMKEERKVKALIDAGYPSDFNGEAYHTVSGQNSNNSIRIPDTFMKAVLENGKWNTTFRTTGKICEEYPAKDLMHQVSKAAWACADPGVQFDDTINKWHTCKNSGRIRASNPCSEYMFLDDTACNLASLNLMKFLDSEGNFNIEMFKHAIRIFIIAQDIIVDFASYPTENIAKNSHDFRTLGIGYANLGTLLMVKGLPYDSDEGRAWAAGITSILTGTSYVTSAEIAEIKHPFESYLQNKESMQEVIGMHLDASKSIDQELCPKYIYDAALNGWQQAYDRGMKSGYRNAQVSVLAPTGTIGLLMDCDTTGVEPDYALVKWKKLAGGGYFKIINQSIPIALRNLGYNSSEIDSIVDYIVGKGSIENAPHINPDQLKKLGLTDAQIKEAQDYVVSVKNIDEWTPHINQKSLIKLGLNENQIKESEVYIGGAQTVEGAPYLKEEHYPIFDCANKCGIGKRFIKPMGHVKMMAAVQPFISGAISKTVNLSHETTAQEMEDIYIKSWQLGLKAIALYRDGCKLSQPLTSTAKNGNGASASKSKSITTELATLTKIAGPHRGEKKALPQVRQGITVETKIGGHKVFLRTGEYDDKSIGEIFIDMHKEGAAFRSMMNCFAIAVSIGLQHGVPIEKFVDAFIFTRFEPQGMTNHPNIKSATSIIDFIFRVIGMHYLNRMDFVHVPPEETEMTRKSSIDMRHPDQADLSKFNQQDKSNQFNKSPSIDPNEDLSKMMGDAPPCTVCGHITVRNGTCYRCFNCGNSMGCS